MTNVHKVKSKTGNITQKMKKISKYLSWSKKKHLCKNYKCISTKNMAS